jgi:hypothetical protein
MKKVYIASKNLKVMPTGFEESTMKPDEALLENDDSDFSEETLANVYHQPSTNQQSSQKKINYAKQSEQKFINIGTQELNTILTFIF